MKIKSRQTAPQGAPLDKKKLAKIREKTDAGEPLTDAERIWLEKQRGDAGIVKTVVELAGALGVTRQTVHSWAQRPDAPKANPDGSFTVAEWRAFAEANRRARGESPEIAALKVRKLLAEVEDREFRLALRRGEYVLKTEVAQEWMTRIGKARQLLESRLLNELPPLLSGKDAFGIRDALDKVVFEFYTTLHNGG